VSETKALIFGANGQDGFYLAVHCRLNGIEPFGVSRSGDWIRGDVADYEFVQTLVNELQPSYIFHLAANSTTRHDALFENHAAISTGTLNILEAVYRSKLPARIFLSGSGLQFVNSGKPINEGAEFEANSPYSVARIQSVYAARFYRTLGVQAYVGFLFHHDSPRRGPHHVSQKIAQAVARIENGSQETIEVGDVSVTKEWTFAGDIAAAMLTLVLQEKVIEAVIGSGETHSIQDWIQQCFAHAKMDWRGHVREISGFKSEYSRLVSDPKLMNSLGWKPTMSFSQLAAMMVDAAA
jgi:GDPmannose 4,6-dehydratase